MPASQRIPVRSRPSNTVPIGKIGCVVIRESVPVVCVGTTGKGVLVTIVVVTIVELVVFPPCVEDDELEVIVVTVPGFGGGGIDGKRSSGSMTSKRADCGMVELLTRQSRNSPDPKRRWP